MNPTRPTLLRMMGAAATATACDRATREGGRILVPLWFSYGGRVRETLLALVRRFNSAQSRYVVHPTYQGDYFEALAKLRTALAAGVAPALSHVVGEVVPYLAAANVLEPLDDYPGARSIPFVRALAQSGSFAHGDRHALVAVPFNRSTPIMYLNRRVTERAGIAPPATWDALRSAARALTEQRDGGIRHGFQVPLSWWFWVAMVAQAGGHLVADDGTVSLGGDAGVRALRFWQQLVREDHSMQPPPGRDYDAWQATHQAFLAEHVPIIWTSTAFLRYLEDNASFPVLAAPLPRDVRAAVPTGGTFFTILRTAPRDAREGAWAFVRWMCEPAQTIAWSTRTGYLPITEPAVAQLTAAGFYAQHPNDRVALDQLAHVEPWPWATNLFRVQRDAVEPRLEEAVLTGRDARAVLDEARVAASEA